MGEVIEEPTQYSFDILEDLPDPLEAAGGEDEDDLDDLDVASFSSVAVSGTDWTVETIVRQLQRGTIILNPKFQRRDAWAERHKSRFIESLFLGLPIPQIVLAESATQRGSFLVIDGKQRLLTLLQFAQSTSPLPEENDVTPLRLRGLEVHRDLNGKTWADLEADAAWSEDLAAFENHTIRTVVVKNWPDERFLYLMFLRLNTGSVKLSPQELRQALHPGPFVDFVDDYAINSSAIQMVLNLRKPDFRMRDVELVTRFYAFEFFLEDYTGNLKLFLDLTCKRLNEQWHPRMEELLRATEVLEDAIDATFKVFDEHAFRRWRGEKFEPFFNRAIFDIMIYYFKDAATREASVENKTSVVEAFKNLSATNPRFTQSVQTTTKSIHATYERISEWGAALQAVLGEDLPIPKLVDGRIRRGPS